MTLGERIQECRKKAGLSQEALGEAMGVTRQSISKWESDTTVPELDKLVALSKLFHIPVGALLGVEEGEALQELTDRELKALSAIAEKLTPAEKKRPRWLLWAMAAVLVLCGYVFFSRMNGLENRLENVQYDMSHMNTNVSRIQSGVNSQIDSIAQRVEEVLAAQNQLTAQQGYEIYDADIAAGTVTFRLWATPRTWREGMTTQFSAAEADPEGNPLETVTVQAVEGEGHTFEGFITFPLTDGITLSLIFTTDGEVQTQVLGQEGSLYSQSLPNIQTMVLPFARIWQKALYRKADSVWVGQGGIHTAQGLRTATAQRCTLRLWRQGELVWSKEVELLDYDDYEPFAELTPIDLNLSVADIPLGGKEEFILSAHFTDTAGRTLERGISSCTVSRDETGYQIGGHSSITAHPWEDQNFPR